jgi:aminomethyltransferase
MAHGTPFHASTAKRCTSMFWKEWAGHLAVRSYDLTHEREYFAIRHGVALIDVSPLFKYEIKGKDAERFLSYVTVKDLGKLKPHQLTYLCWCDDNGHVLDDGTVLRLSEDRFRLSSAEPAFAWLSKCQRRFDVTITDVTKDMGVVSVQGPNSKAMLAALDPAVLELKYFKHMNSTLGGVPVEITRTGYTGDLGYELWVAKDQASELYEKLMQVGEPFHISPCGLDAMDVARIEAGFILNGVDYISASKCLIESRKMNPYEVGLGWCVQMDRAAFLGQAALKRIAAYGAKRSRVGLEMDWDELEAAYLKHGLGPQLCSQAWRDGRPVYNPSGQFIGQATSGTWSPILKKNIALATVPTNYARLGQKLRMEATIEYERVPITATVVELPFFNPKRKRD